MTTSAEKLFWQLTAELQRDDPRIREGTIMNGRCLRVGKEFLGIHWGAQECSALRDRDGTGQHLRNPKVQDLDEASPAWTTRQEEVRRLEIA